MASEPGRHDPRLPEHPGDVVRQLADLHAEHETLDQVAQNLAREKRTLRAERDRWQEKYETATSERQEIVDQHAPAWLERLERARELETDERIENGLHAVSYILRSYHESHAAQKMALRRLTAERTQAEQKALDVGRELYVTKMRLGVAIRERDELATKLGDVDGEIVAYEADGCFTGDCSHESQSACDTYLRHEYIPGFIGALREVLAGATPAGDRLDTDQRKAAEKVRHVLETIEPGTRTAVEKALADLLAVVDRLAPKPEAPQASVTPRKSPLEVVRAARELLADPERWTKRRLAVDAAGNSVGVMTPEAVRWDIIGALFKVDSPLRDHPEEIKAIERAIGIDNDDLHHNVTGWHDDPARTHAEVLAALDAAIAMLTPEEKETPHAE